MPTCLRYNHDMRTPSFWQHQNGPANWLLPFTVPYYLGFLLRRAYKRWRYGQHQLPVPVLIIGNATAGGTGKTPFAIALATWLQGTTEHQVAVVGRGHQGGAKGVVRVDPDHHQAREVGDEPLLLARIAPCFVGKNRLAACQEAIAQGATLVLCDDGMQDPTLLPSSTLMVIDRSYGIGNGHLLPAGPLREPWPKALARADMLIWIGAPSPEPKTAHALEIPSHIPEIHVPITPPTLPKACQGKPLLAFAGIGRPQKFFDSVVEAGGQIAKALPFADHHAYTQKDLAQLERLITEENLVPITTEKDAVRLPPDIQARVHTLPLTLTLPPAAQQALRETLTQQGVRL